MIKNNRKIVTMIMFLIVLQLAGYGITFTTTQPNGSSDKNIAVISGTQYQLTFDLLHQTTNNIRLVLSDGVSTYIDASNLIDGNHSYSFTTMSNSINVKFVRVDNDNSFKTFEVNNLNVARIVKINSAYTINHNIGEKEYEITDYIGSVREVISDKSDALGVAGVLSAFDYYPFGMVARSYKGAGYKYLYSGQEIASEYSEDDNILIFEHRIHDARLGRFLSIDPLYQKYPHNSPYSFCENSVIAYIEMEGLEKATPEMKQKAIEAINSFQNNGKSGKWTNIEKAKYATSLLAMVNDSRVIDQASTNLCGIAATCKLMIEYDPENFVNAAISLYEEGYADNVSTFHANIDANSALFDKKPSNGLDEASYVIMTSMRHSYNLTNSYDPATDGGLDGFTYPGDISDIAKNFANMKDVTYNYTQDVTGLNKAMGDEASVVALFDIDQLKTGKPSTDYLQKTFGSHYVTINSIKEEGDNVTVNYWNWGDTSKTQTTITTTKENYDKAIKNYTILNSAKTE